MWVKAPKAFKPPTFNRSNVICGQGALLNKNQLNSWFFFVLPLLVVVLLFSNGFGQSVERTQLIAIWVAQISQIHGNSAIAYAR
jgi:hypothetical protein